MLLSSQDVALPHATTGQGQEQLACMCCLEVQVAVYILLVWVSGNVPCVRWVVFVVVSYACLCMVCVCVCMLQLAMHAYACCS